MNIQHHKQSGLSLIVAMIMLLVLTILVISGVRGTTMGERMSGNHMERTRAYQAAEQALSQGLATLQNNGDSCLSGCTNATSPAVAGAGIAQLALPTAWVDTNAADVTKATAQASTARYAIHLLPQNATFRPIGKESCMPYSVMGRGVGLNSASVVILQTVAFVCPI